MVGGVAGYAVAVARRRGGSSSSEHLVRSEEQIRSLTQQHEAIAQDLESERAAVVAARERVAAMEAEMKGMVDRLAEQKEFVEATRKQLTDTFAATGQKALDANSERFLKLASETYKPIQELLTQQGKAVRDLEEKRVKTQGQTEQMIEQVLASSELLKSETSKLVTALRRPEQRGRWGELQLRNVVELAGMVDHCDFIEQASVDTDEGPLRPDMVINLPGGGTIVVDAKVALDHYLNAMDDADHRSVLLDRHADAVSTHFKSLASKKYWKHFDPSPELVVMFMPLESALVAALERKPDLHAEAIENRVLIATPTLLVGLLRAVAFGWRQESLHENARRIADVGKELHERLNVFAQAYTDVGTRLKRTVDAYNKSVNSMESRLLVSARRMRALGTAGDEIDRPAEITEDVKPLSEHL